MVGDPRDAWAYRIAIGALGLALLTVLVGAIVLAALDGPNVVSDSKTHPKPHGGLAAKTDPESRAVSISPTVSITLAGSADPGGSRIPTGLYVLGGALVGALLGIMIPLSWPSTLSLEQWLRATGKGWPAVPAAVLPAIALVVVIACLGFAKKWVPHEDVAIVGAAALLGLLVPSPAKRW
jgi:hypothetical protein